MINIEKQVSYWKTGAQEDWIVAKELIERDRIRHGLFFAHLALEKAIKAHVCRSQKDLAPRIHNLLRLIQLTGLNSNPDQLEILAEMNAFNIESRYPESFIPLPTSFTNGRCKVILIFLNQFTTHSTLQLLHLASSSQILLNISLVFQELSK